MESKPMKPKDTNISLISAIQTILCIWIFFIFPVVAVYVSAWDTGAQWGVLHGQCQAAPMKGLSLDQCTAVKFTK